MAEQIAAEPNLVQLCAALDAIGSTLKSQGEQRLLNEAYGWNVAGVSRDDLVELVTSLASRIRAQIDTEVSAEGAVRIQVAIKGLNFAATNTIPQIFNGNASSAIPALLLTVYSLESQLSDIFRWPVEPGIYSVPPRLAKKIRAAEARVRAVDDSTSELGVKVEKILAAHEAAESLDVDMAALADASEKTKRLEADARIAAKHADEAFKEMFSVLGMMKESQASAAAIVEKCEDAYRIATSKGLAGAFDERASKLNVSIRWWTGFLIVALGLGAVIGYDRVHALNGLLSNATPTWGAIALHIGVALVSVGAPFWFAWLATKQIGQRFRIAEDYAFKASVSKAYEGYRKEAVRIDPQFESRLFGSALSRLEEPPLRLLADEKNHGSPYHELVFSKAFEKAMAIVPELREKVRDIASKQKSVDESKKEKDNDSAKQA